ncbi:MAG: sigma-70 family RNA polymerase sigma factor [Proteobacteria bacterium]|nr:sigma-70 family RNA polymerase sigma factor [Pseudomonadota bacterium]MBU1710717.1 sigma-70 family RNA polymerase sigma factor [Pseudomonadota bacterium]
MIISQIAVDLLKETSHPALSRYLEEVDLHPVLSKDEVFALAKQFKEDEDHGAGQQLLSSHLRLVIKIVWDFQDYWQGNIMDLVQEGNVGLIIAQRKFDPSRNVQFTTYAFYWIYSYISRYILNNWRLVKICTARSKRLLFFRMRNEAKKIVAQCPIEFSRVLAERLDVSEVELEDMIQRIHGEDIAFEDSHEVLSDIDHQIMMQNGIVREAMSADLGVKARVRSVINKMAGDLNQREQAILKFRLLGDEVSSLREIGEMFQLSRERIRQIEDTLVIKLEKALKQEFSDLCLEQGI